MVFVGLGGSLGWIFVGKSIYFMLLASFKDWWDASLSEDL